MTAATAKEIFIIKMLYKEHCTWQGLITSVSGKQTKPFRSLLELISLMESTLIDSNE